MSESNKTVLKTLAVLALGYVAYTFYRSNQPHNPPGVDNTSNAIKGVKQ